MSRGTHDEKTKTRFSMLCTLIIGEVTLWPIGARGASNLFIKQVTVLKNLLIKVLIKSKYPLFTLGK